MQEVRALSCGHTTCYLVRSEVSTLLVDTGWPHDELALKRSLGACGVATRDLDWLFCTHYHPDHMGLAGELQKDGVRLLVADVQLPYVHAADATIRRAREPFTPVDEGAATIVSVEGSAAFLSALGIAAELVHTPSHSSDHVCLLLADGTLLAGDLTPIDIAWGDAQLEADWELLLEAGVERPLYAHWPDLV